jgi:hypothetical protein
MDHTLKMWDLRFSNAPIEVWDNLINTVTKTGCCLSPDERIMMVGVSGDLGGVKMIDTASFEIVGELKYQSHGIVPKWHHGLNQMFVGLGNGDV